MAFEWVAFLEANHIHYVTSGPNVSRGNIAVRCPFCGAADKSQHMSISLTGKGWRCFRNRDEHAGKSPVYLVAALLGLSVDRARQIVGDAVFIPDDFMGAVLGKLNPPAPMKKEPLTLPPEFKPFRDKPSAKHFIAYLEQRGFSRKQVLGFTEGYDLRYATTGAQKGRIVFPIIHDGELVSWTGRTIYSQVDLRYKTLGTDPEDPNAPASLGPINDYLLWYDDLVTSRNDTLLLCEGPFDALKVAVLGKRHGIDATCFFTASPSARQIDLLFDVAPRYKRKFLLLDRGTLGTAMRVQSSMSAMKIPFLSLPDRVKDPGELDEKNLLKILACKV